MNTCHSCMPGYTDTYSLLAGLGQSSKLANEQSFAVMTVSSVLKKITCAPAGNYTSSEGACVASTGGTTPQASLLVFPRLHTANLLARAVQLGTSAGMVRSTHGGIHAGLLGQHTAGSAAPASYQSSTLQLELGSIFFASLSPTFPGTQHCAIPPHAGSMTGYLGSTPLVPDPHPWYHHYTRFTPSYHHYNTLVAAHSVVQKK